MDPNRNQLNKFNMLNPGWFLSAMAQNQLPPQFINTGLEDNNFPRINGDLTQLARKVVPQPSPSNKRPTSQLSPNDSSAKARKRAKHNEVETRRRLKEKALFAELGELCREPIEGIDLDSCVKEDSVSSSQLKKRRGGRGRQGMERVTILEKAIAYIKQTSAKLSEPQTVTTENSSLPVSKKMFGFDHLDLSPYFVTVSDISCHFIWGNLAYYRHLGYSDSEYKQQVLKGSNIMELLPPESYGAVYKSLSEMTFNDTRGSADVYSVRCKDGTFTKLAGVFALAQCGDKKLVQSIMLPYMETSSKVSRQKKESASVASPNSTHSKANSNASPK